MQRINELFRPMGICFVLSGYSYIENNSLYEETQFYNIYNYVNLNGYVNNNSLNVFVVNTLSVGNGVTYPGDNILAIKRSHFIGNPWDIFPGNVLAHELAHDFYLMHPWGNGIGTIYTEEHVSRDPNDPNYNALDKGDKVHDTPAMVSFYHEALAKGLTIYDIIDSESCEYLGDLTDNLGTPFELNPTDVGNVMAYTYQPCITSGFTTGQGIRIREWIANPPVNDRKKSLLAKRPNSQNIDLYIKDSEEDFGEEPNYISPYTWTSPDIWVRHQKDFVLEHQNPEYHPTKPNYIHVKIANRGCNSSSGNDQLKLYWSKATTSLMWDYHWDSNNNFSNNAPVGGEIGTITIPPINSNDEIVLTLPWVTPNPNLYSNINNEPWHFCLLARIISNDDPMSHIETINLADNVRNNNNIAQKNITVVDLESNDITKNLGGGICYR